MKKTVQTSDAKSVPFLPVFKAYLLDFQQIGNKNKRPDIVYYTTTRKYRELQQNGLCVVSDKNYTTTRKYRELQQNLHKVDLTDNYTTTRKYRELQHVYTSTGEFANYTTTRKYRELLSTTIFISTI